MKILTFKLKLLAAIIVGFAIIGGQLFAVPAPNRPVQLEQPDGSTVTVLIHGDERNSWISTTDGYSVARNPQGFFEYVQRIDRDAILVLSGIRMAPNVQQRSDAEKTFLQSISKHLRVTPLPQPKEEAQKSQGSDPSGARNWLMHRPNNHDVFSKRGRFKSIVVPVHFADFPLTYSQAEIDSALNAENYTGHGCKGSVRDYFHDMSGGQFTPEFLVLPPYTAQHNRVGYYAYGDPYSSGSTEGIELKLEVYYYVNAVLRERALEEFDGNGDGIIDHISIIFAGQGQELTGNIGMIWSNHSWRYTSGSLRPINYIHFTAVSEIDNFNDRLGIATYCHEFGHTLGLPDFYDTDNETNGFADHPDDHDLMSSNTGTGHPVGMSAVSRFALGWLNLKTVGTAASISLPDVTMVLYKNGEPVAEGKGAAVLGDPAEAVAWLANCLWQYGVSLRAGEVILSGAFSAAPPAKLGDVFEARFPDFGTVTASFV